MRSSSDMVTVSPTSLPIARRTSAFTGSLCLPSPRAINELRKGCPSILPLTFTKPRVPKNLTEFGQITYVQPPLAELFCNLAENFLSSFMFDLPQFRKMNIGESIRARLTPQRADQAMAIKRTCIGIRSHRLVAGLPRRLTPARAA